MTSPNNNGYIKFTGLAFQMLAAIAIPAYIGFKLDENNATKFWTPTLTLVGVLFAIIYVIYNVNKLNKK